jgi:hypothetical protein
MTTNVKISPPGVGVPSLGIVPPKEEKKFEQEKPSDQAPDQDAEQVQTRQGD